LTVTTTCVGEAGGKVSLQIVTGLALGSEAHIAQQILLDDAFHTQDRYGQIMVEEFPRKIRGVIAGESGILVQSSSE
jgi:hypothetical protein